MTTTPTDSTSPPPQPPSRWRRLLRRFNLIFVLTVAAPTAIAAVYFGLTASDVYISESHFVVLSPQHNVQSGLGALLAASGITRTHDDAYTVRDFMVSRDALSELESRLKLRAHYGSGSIDLLSRFPGLDWDDSFEAFFRHYGDHLELAYDTSSSIMTLRVRAFSPQMSKDVNELLLQMGERLVNNLNDHSRKDLIVVAQGEVTLAEERARKAAIALNAYRNKGKLLDPARQAELQLDTTTRLREDLRVTENQIAQLRQVAPSNPQIPTLVEQAARLRRAIDAETAVAVGGINSLSDKSIVYERLALDKEFADRTLASALAALEAARADAARKQLYLERLVQPNLPDTALEPRRVRSVLTVFLVGLVVWGVVSLLVAGVREHVD